MIELMLGSADIDVMAVWLAATGRRRVELNAAERLVAAALILAGGGRQADVGGRCGVSKSEASRIAALPYVARTRSISCATVSSASSHSPASAMRNALPARNQVSNVRSPTRRARSNTSTPRRHPTIPGP